MRRGARRGGQRRPRESDAERKERLDREMNQYWEKGGQKDVSKSNSAI